MTSTTNRLSEWEDAHRGAYAFFVGQVDMTLQLQAEGLWTADEALSRLRDALAELERKRAAADAAYKAAVA